MSALYQKFIKFLPLLRWDDWKNVKIAFVLLSILYFQYLTHFLGSGFFFYLNFSLLLIFSLCYYGFLFLTNDFFDLDQDLRGGKRKAITYFTKSNVIFIIIGLLFISLFSLALAWNYATPASAAVLISGYFLAFFYSSPPIRFKERGFWGVSVGSLVLRPVCLAILFAGFRPGPFMFDLLLMFVWLEILGLRRIINHQIEDYQRDIRGGVKTFTTRVGISTAQYLNRIVLLPLEALFLFSILSLMVFRIRQLAFIISAYIIIHLILYFKKRGASIIYFSFTRPLFYDLYFLFLPLQLSFLVAKRESVWAILFFVVLWQTSECKNFWSLITNVVANKNQK